jgi:superfamily II DNA helicase RecQ
MSASTRVCKSCNEVFSSRNDLDNHRRKHHQKESKRTFNVNGFTWTQTFVKNAGGRWGCSLHPWTKTFSSATACCTAVKMVVEKPGSTPICDCHAHYIAQEPSSASGGAPPAEAASRGSLPSSHSSSAPSAAAPVSSSSSSSTVSGSAHGPRWVTDAAARYEVLAAQQECKDPQSHDGALGMVPEVFLQQREERFRTDVTGLAIFEDLYIELFRAANQSDQRSFNQFDLEHRSVQEDKTVVLYAKAFAKASVYALIICASPVADPDDPRLLQHGELTRPESQAAMYLLREKCVAMHRHFFVGLSNVGGADDSFPEDDEFSDSDDESQPFDAKVQALDPIPEAPADDERRAQWRDIVKEVWFELVSETVPTTVHYHLLVQYAFDTLTRGNDATPIDTRQFSRVFSALNKGIIYRDVCGEQLGSAFWRNSRDMKYAHAVLHHYGVNFRRMAQNSISERVELSEASTRVSVSTNKGGSVQFSLTCLAAIIKSTTEDLFSRAAHLLDVHRDCVYAFRPDVYDTKQLVVNDPSGRLHCGVPLSEDEDDWVRQCTEFATILATLVYLGCGKVFRGTELVRHRVVSTGQAPKDVHCHPFGSQYAVYLSSSYTKTSHYRGFGSSWPGAVIGPIANLLLLYIGFIRPACAALLRRRGVPVEGFLFLAEDGGSIPAQKVSRQFAAQAQRANGARVQGVLGFSVLRQGIIAFQKVFLGRLLEDAVTGYEEAQAQSHNHSLATMNSTYGNSKTGNLSKLQEAAVFANSHILMLHRKPSQGAQPQVHRVGDFDGAYAQYLLANKFMSREQLVELSTTSSPTSVEEMSERQMLVDIVKRLESLQQASVSSSFFSGTPHPTSVSGGASGLLATPTARVSRSSASFPSPASSSSFSGTLHPTSVSGGASGLMATPTAQVSRSSVSFPSPASSSSFSGTLHPTSVSGGASGLLATPTASGGPLSMSRTTPDDAKAVRSVSKSVEPIDFEGAFDVDFTDMDVEALTEGVDATEKAVATANANLQTIHPGTDGFRANEIKMAAVHMLLGCMHVLLVAPTGSGKSSVILTLALEATKFGKKVLVVVPSSALVTSKTRFGSDGTAIISHGAVRGSTQQAWDEQVVYTTYETLCNPSWGAGADVEDFAYVIFDEAHALYLNQHFRSAARTGVLKLMASKRPVLHMTATAPAAVVSFLSSLGARMEPQYPPLRVLRSPSYRTNLALSVLMVNDVPGRAVSIVQTHLEAHTQSDRQRQRVIVFCGQVDACEAIAGAINTAVGDSGCAVPFYSSLATKRENLNVWMAEDQKVRVIVATSGLAEGVDVSGIELVVFAGMLNDPSLTMLVQAMGRGGRSTERSCQCVFVATAQLANQRFKGESPAERGVRKETIHFLLDKTSCRTERLMRYLGYPNGSIRACASHSQCDVCADRNRAKRSEVDSKRSTTQIPADIRTAAMNARRRIDERLRVLKGHCMRCLVEGKEDEVHLLTDCESVRHKRCLGCMANTSDRSSRGYHAAGSCAYRVNFSLNLTDTGERRQLTPFTCFKCCRSLWHLPAECRLKDIIKPIEGCKYARKLSSIKLVLF